MGKVSKIFYEKIIEPAPDRNPNIIKTQIDPNGEVIIHFRNLKIVLHTQEEIVEWKHGFQTALDNFNRGNYFKNDI